MSSLVLRGIAPSLNAFRFDPVGHYSRPDVTQLIVNRRRRSTLRLDDSSPDTSLSHL